MADLDVILQPEEYRTSDQKQVSAWAFFPNLRLLFGWGDGLWETLGDRMSAVRTAFVIVKPSRPIQRELEAFFGWLDSYDERRPPMPFYARALQDSGHDCLRLHANDICTTFAGPPRHALHGQDSHHPLEANANYRVAHAVSDDRRICLTVEQRFKTLKPEFTAKMDELGLAHEHGTGKRAQPKPADQKRERRQRDGNEQAFVRYVEDRKEGYRVTRVLDLLGDPASRPARFIVQMAELERSRSEAIARGKRDNGGTPYRPYTEDELLLATCHSVVAAEATDLAFDYAWRPVRAFDARGLVHL